MVNGSIVLLCLFGVALAIFLNYKWNLNMGISALVFSFIIGVLFLGMRVKEVIALFPTSVFFQVMSLSLFFFASESPFNLSNALFSLKSGTT